MPLSIVLCQEIVPLLTCDCLIVTNKSMVFKYYLTKINLFFKLSQTNKLFVIVICKDKLVEKAIL